MSLTWKIGRYFTIVLLSVGQYLNLWPAIKTLFPDGLASQQPQHIDPMSE